MHAPRSLGCLSPLALISAVLTGLVLVILQVTSGSTMFSPGPLNAQVGAPAGGVSSHAEIGKDCGQCHPAPWSGQTMAERCLACHTDVQAALQDASSMHRVLAQNESTACQNCHTEHHGAAAGLTVMDTLDFPHDVTGFALSGHPSHADRSPFTCADCHTDSVSSFSQDTCTACHRKLDSAYSDAHLQTFGADCLACHDGGDRYGDFDHNLVNYPLEGAHQQAACAACHPNARAISDLQNTPADCQSCHLAEDAHEGRFGLQCESCHTPTTWEEASFDHSLSAFPLDGAHVDVDCQECHADQVFEGTPHACAACHADPAYHAGLFADQACQDCHTTSAWRPARYDGPHTFPMNHGEENNTCADCHQPNLTTWTCYTCHEQAEITRKHQEEVSGDFNDCLRCHATGEKDEAEGGD